MSKVDALGIIGAGKLGVVLAQLAIKAGYRVYISGSGDPSKIALSVEVLAPGALPMTSEEVAQQSDAIVLALPLSRFQDLPKDSLAEKLVIDATNHWWETDGRRDDFLDPLLSSSEAVQKFLARSRVVKALNHMGYHDLHDETRPSGEAGRKAIALAGDDQNDVAMVARIIERFGFDPVHIGELSKGRKLEPGGRVFGANVDAKTLAELLTD